VPNSAKGSSRIFAFQILRLLAAASMLAIFAGVSSRVYAQDQPRERVSPLLNRPFGLNPGDIIDVQVFNTPEISAKYQLNKDGAIRLPGTPPVVLSDLSPTEAATALEKLLKDSKVMDSAQVSVFLVTAAPFEVSVIGEIVHPGLYELSGLPTLQSALAAAGGVTALEGPTITITHRNDLQGPLTVSVIENPPYGVNPFQKLNPWDIVSVSRTGVVYVVGDVARPGEYNLKTNQKLGALEVLALAAGLKEYAAPEKATIIRMTASSVDSIPINLARIQKKLDIDPPLGPDDVLVVPHSGTKQFINTLIPGLSITAANAIALALVVR
jgi:polysaccharide biosynthesis/export protein